MAGCGSEAQTAAPKPSKAETLKPAPATKSADPEEGAVLDAYAALLAAEERTYEGVKLDKGVERYATDAALADIKETLFFYERSGTEMRGARTSDPKVTAVDMEADPAKATVTDCVDSSGFKEVESKSGEAVPVKSKKRRHFTSATVVKLTEGWAVSSLEIDGGRTC